MIPKVFLRPHCDECDGVRLLFESSVKWDFKAQQYRVVTVTGSSFCEDCTDDVTITWKEEPLNPSVPTGGWPDQASWIAQDANGQWCWYLKKPVKGSNAWLTGWGETMVPGEDYGDMKRGDRPDNWTTTLHPVNEDGEEVEP